MRWRNGLMGCVDSVIGLLLSQNEADCLIPQHRKQSLWLSEPTASDQTTNYRASGLVHWPISAELVTASQMLEYDGRICICSPYQADLPDGFQLGSN
jgi:hypothetical protein